MSTNGGPNIVRDSSLVLWLDAADKKSYSGSGSTWTDLTTNGNNGTLVNSPSFNNGTLTFNGSNTYINIGAPVITANNNISISCWFNTFDKNQQGQMISYVGSDAGGNGYGFAVNKEGVTTGNILMLYGAVAWIDTGFNAISNTWYNGVMNILSDRSNQFFVNGKLVYTGGSNTVYAPTSYTNIGRNDYPVARYFNGKIATTLFYNRALQPNEILQNYNALKGRFLL
jgi:hypothetical protein